MKKILFLLTISLGSLGQNLQADVGAQSPKVFYGEDDRELISSLHKTRDERYIREARSVFAQVDKKELIPSGNQYLVHTESAAKAFGMCKEEKFSMEPSLSKCTGFLVAPDILMTAGHCIKNQKACQKAAWIMDYRFNGNLSVKKNASLLFNQSNVVTCAGVIASVENKKMDYALIKLNRKVTDRIPFKLRESGTVTKNEELHIIGHPLGMPKILTTNVIVSKTSDRDFFSVIADTFGGNSGSPVINKSTGVVEGILVRGEQDFAFKYTGFCNKIKRCTYATCGSGEHVQRTSVLPLHLIK